MRGNTFESRDAGISGAKIITPFLMTDERGYFLKYYEKDIFEELGISGQPYEDFETFSTKGVIRGLHFQTESPQEKIVHVIWGTVSDVIVDLRKGSETFGKHITIELSDQNHQLMYIPRGFAHGFEVLSDAAIMSYKCIGKYIKEADTGIHYRSEELGIEWKTDAPIISEKDTQLMDFGLFRKKYGGL